jgi:hypothetical protein
LLTLVAERPRPLASLDQDAVESLRRDGLVLVAEGVVALPG